MSVRKRTWTPANGEPKEAWIVDYTDQSGRRRLKTFKRKKDADAYHSRANVEVSEGIHTPDSASITVATAAEKWLGSCRGLERTTVASYGQHIKLHIVPLLGGVKLSKLNVPTIRAFEDKLREDRSDAMVKKILSSLSSIVGDAQERGLIARNVVRDLRSRRSRGKENQAERRAKGKLKVRAKYRGLHSLRHFYASWCINRKADGGLELPLKSVQTRLGHSTLAMTADTYGHLFPSNDDGSELAAAERGLLG